MRASMLHKLRHKVVFCGLRFSFSINEGLLYESSVEWLRAGRILRFRLTHPNQTVSGPL